MSAAGSDDEDTELERIRRDYTFAFLTYRVEGTEQRLQAAYELGRKALASGLSLLDLSTVHHEVIAEALLTARDEEALRDVAVAASAFFIEVLATFEMAQRAFTEIHQTHGTTPADPDATPEPTTRQ